MGPSARSLISLHMTGAVGGGQLSMTASQTSGFSNIRRATALNQSDTSTGGLWTGIRAHTSGTAGGTWCYLLWEQRGIWLGEEQK